MKNARSFLAPGVSFILLLCLSTLTQIEMPEARFSRFDHNYHVAPILHVVFFALFVFRVQK